MFEHTSENPCIFLYNVHMLPFLSNALLKEGAEGFLFEFGSFHLFPPFVFL